MFYRKQLMLIASLILFSFQGYTQERYKASNVSLRFDYGDYGSSYFDEYEDEHTVNFDVKYTKANSILNFDLGLLYSHASYYRFYYSSEFISTTTYVNALDTTSVIEVDSFDNTYYSSTKDREVFGLNLRLSCSTNRDRKFIMSAGINLSPRISFNSRYSNYYSKYYTEQINSTFNNYINPYNYQFYNNQYESGFLGYGRTNNIIIVNMSVPISLEYRLSKKINILDRFITFVEVSPTLKMNFDNASFLDTKTSIAVSTGIRYRINNEN